jgi:hypothetical protein
MIERLNDYDQQRILGVVKSAAKDVATGANPNNAIVKYASSARLSKDLVKRACEAFNVSKTLAHLGENEGEKRAEAFAIADPNAILEKMWPEKVAFTITREELSEDSFDLTKYVKSASKPKDTQIRDNIVLDEISQDSIDKALDQIKAASTRKIEELHTASTSAYLHVTENLKKVASHFDALYRPDFEAFSKWAFEQFGEGEMDTLRLIGESMSTKQASATISPTKSLKEDYEELHASIKQAGQVLASYNIWREETKKLVEKIAESNKQPMLGDTLGPMFKNPVLRNPTNAILGSVQFNPRNEAMREQNIKYNPFADPLMQNVSETRTLLDSAIALHNAMKEDEVLSQADPTTVIQNYNDIFAAVPEMVRYPSLLKSTLRHATEYGQLDSSAMQGLLETYAKAKKDNPAFTDPLVKLREGAGDKAKEQMEGLSNFRKDLAAKQEEAAKTRAEVIKSRDEKNRDKEMQALTLEEKRHKVEELRKQRKKDEAGGTPVPEVGKSNKKTK